MKVIIAGSRKGITLADVYAAVEESGFEITEVISGCAPGADTLGEQWAKENKIPVKSMPADWDDLSHPDAVIKVNERGKEYDARAGYRRNVKMADYAKEHKGGLIALRVPYRFKSNGTDDMMAIAKEKDLEWYVKVVEHASL